MLHKLVIIALAVVGTIAACSDSTSNSKSTADSATAAAPAKPADPDVEKGLALVGQSDCFQCHKIDEDHTGPAYVAVAKRYAAAPADTVKFIASKIITGGAGRWGSVQMTAHPELSQADAELMTKYVLSLK